MILDELGRAKTVATTVVAGVLPGGGRCLEVVLDGVDREGVDDVGGDANLGGDRLDLLPGGVEVLDDGAVGGLELGAEVGEQGVVEVHPLVGCLLRDDERCAGRGLQVVHIDGDDRLELNVVVTFGGPSGEVLAHVCVEVSACVAGVVEVLGEGGQVRIRFSNDAVCVDDDRATVGVRAEDLGCVDVAGGIDLRLLLPDHAADGCDDREDDDSDGGDDDDAGAAVSTLLRLAHLGGFRAHGIDGRLFLLSHGLTFRK